MSQSVFRAAVCCVLALLLPVQLLAADSTPAMLYANGAAWIDGAAVPKSIAMYAGESVQTRSDSTANLNTVGSSVLVLGNSLMKFQGPAVELSHGAVRVSTSKQLAAQAGEVTIKPVNSAWTEFQVASVDGRVLIAANKGDVTIQDQQGTTTLSQGQQTTREETTQPEKKNKRKGNGGPPPAATGGIMSNPWVMRGGVIIVGGVTLWAILQHDEPASPSCRTDPCN